jgi:hypothetical protein
MSEKYLSTDGMGQKKVWLKKHKVKNVGNQETHQICRFRVCIVDVTRAFRETRAFNEERYS